VIQAGGLGKGGMNFDAKVRRQSIGPDDLIEAHIGGVDLCARAFITAARIIEDRHLGDAVSARYADWSNPENEAMLMGDLSLADIAARAEAKKINPTPRSGRQEHLENMVSRYF
jgi:xylose isomerase